MSVQRTSSDRMAGEDDGVDLAVNDAAILLLAVGVILRLVYHGLRKAVEAERDDVHVTFDDDCSDLRAWVLGPTGDERGHGEEPVIPFAGATRTHL